MDYATIGEILEVPLGTVKSRIYRGRMLLRELLSAERGESWNRLIWTNWGRICRRISMANSAPSEPRPIEKLMDESPEARRRLEELRAVLRSSGEPAARACPGDA